MRQGPGDERGDERETRRDTQRPRSGGRPVRQRTPPAPAEPPATPRRGRRPPAAGGPKPAAERAEQAAANTPTATPPAAETEARAEDARPGRRGRGAPRTSHSNALGQLIEEAFLDPNAPVRSYSELERHSGISREALSRYVTPRPDRRRSPTIETLASIGEAMHLSLEQVCRAAAAGARGELLPASAAQRVRDEVIAPLLGALTEAQFAAVVELLRQMRPRES